MTWRKEGESLSEGKVTYRHLGKVHIKLFSYSSSLLLAHFIVLPPHPHPTVPSLSVTLWELTYIL